MVFLVDGDAWRIGSGGASIGRLLSAVSIALILGVRGISSFWRASGLLAGLPMLSGCGGDVRRRSRLCAVPACAAAMFGTGRAFAHFLHVRRRGARGGHWGCVKWAV